MADTANPVPEPAGENSCLPAINANKAVSPNLSLLDHPVGGQERISSVDTLRGLALLGILVINITMFSQPFSAFLAPQLVGGFTGMNFATWAFSHLFFYEKFISLFSMLFGAGLVLMGERAESSGRVFGKIYFRRLRWLFIIGMIHAYFLWVGDILVTYALCGFILYPFRKRPPRFLITWGVVFLIAGMLIMSASGAALSFLRGQAQKAQAAAAAGEELTAPQESLLEGWKKTEQEFTPPPEKLAEETAAYRGGYWDTVKYRAPLALMMQTMTLMFMALWRVVGLMLIGMGLMKAGVFSAARSMRFYRWCLIIGFGLGFPMVAIGMKLLIDCNFDVIRLFLFVEHFNYIGSIPMALGYIGLVMIAVKSGRLTGLTRRLAAVGQMALTNYLMHSVVFVFVFYGFGLGLFGSVDRFAAFCMVVAMWLVQLYLSPLWLNHFRFGPAEWFWRTMTYRKTIPFRRSPTVEPSSAS